MARKALAPLPKYWTIGKAERDNVNKAMRLPLSGYIGGQPSNGYWINSLVDEWCATFGVYYAIPCNSATSGLLAACMAANIGEGDRVWVSTYTMSATATAPLALGATVEFVDIEPEFFCISYVLPGKLPKAIIVTNLFGHPALITQLRTFCDQNDIILIEDNAQAPFAALDGKFAGTVGHMGVFSLNVHKHIQCGEGGVIVTDNSVLAIRLEGAINHGELSPVNLNRLGLNLRMTEPVAAIACAQLKKGIKNVQSRIELAETITDIFKQVSFVIPPAKRYGAVHVYYLWAGKIAGDDARLTRERFISGLVQRRVPFKCGYSPLLHKLFKEDYSLPVAEEIENERLFTFEICAYDPKSHHLLKMRDIILLEADKIEKEHLRGTQEVGRKRSGRSSSEVLGSL